MSTRRRALLLLPSPLGLLEYDVLENRAFFGPGKRGGLEARPNPFPKAVAAITSDDGENWRIKALPGEDDPEVNGSAAGQRVLRDGDRIKIGSDVVLFRATPAPAPAATAASSPSSPPRPPSTRSRAPAARSRGPKRNPVATVLTTVGTLLVLVAIIRAVDYLGSLKAAKDSARVGLPEAPTLPQGDEQRAIRELVVIRNFEMANPTRLEAVLQRYRSFIERHPKAAEIDAAQERIREITETWAQSERTALQRAIEQDLDRGRFARALVRLREFEQQFGATQAGRGTEQLETEVQTAAAAAWKETLGQVEPLVEKNPELARTLLMRRRAQWPVTLRTERDILLAQIDTRIEASKPKRRVRRPAPGRETPPPRGPTPPPARPDAQPEKPEAPDPGAGDGGPAASPEQLDAQVRAAWREGHKHLNAARFREALPYYERIFGALAEAPIVKREEDKLRAGYYAAHVGVTGPAALLEHGKARMEGKELVAEYVFDTADVLEDFDTARPISSERESHVQVKDGMAHMYGTSGLVLNMVFTGNVRVDATVNAYVAHDFGMIAVEESDDFRALIFTINNRRFGLKKTSDRIEQAGHIIWFVGKGVWSAADDDAHGYIKIAEEARSKIKDGDELTLYFERVETQYAGAGFKGKTDKTRLRGQIKGDDGSTMAANRVGLYTDTGKIGVKKVSFRGEVDQAWFAKHLGFLVAGDPGPD